MCVVTGQKNIVWPGLQYKSSNIECIYCVCCDRPEEHCVAVPAV